MVCRSILDLKGLHPDQRGIVKLATKDPELEEILEFPKVDFHKHCWAWIR
jgi:hypothetical protein